LYITGGVAIKNPYLTDNNTFREEFVTIDNYRDKLDAIGIRLNTNEEIGLLGCAYYGMMKLALH
jgi:glucokinase